MTGAEAGNSDPNSRSIQPGEGLAQLARAFHASRTPEAVDTRIPSVASATILAAIRETAYTPSVITESESAKWWETDKDPDDHRWNT